MRMLLLLPLLIIKRVSDLVSGVSGLGVYTETDISSCGSPKVCMNTSINMGLMRVSNFTHCCNTDICNNKTVTAALSEDINGRKCYTCTDMGCDQTLHCEGEEDRCISATVIGNPWVAYTGAKFEGIPTVYEEGEYPNVYYNDDISSLELVTEDLHNPQITLYEEENYKGRSLVLHCETNLLYGTFNDTTSSHKVQRGAWVLYQHQNKGGYIEVARAGRDVPQYTWFDNRLSHVRPMKPGNSSVKAEIQWDKKTVNTKSVIINSITGVNYGSEKQTFTTELSREFSGSVTESFVFSNSTHVSYGTKFSFSLYGVSQEHSFNISNTFTVEKGSSNTRTTTKSIKVTLPASIPPGTKLTVNIVRKEVTVRVPVMLTITSNSNTVVEYGEFFCEDGNTIDTEFREEKISR
ncbi:Epidermal differentiation-specific protein [Bagarius yarrelli]|uniref:Epidermal differentiation-specific protein n=1 Tax=Bagarius yarrelli TaxID=175774 RepID=A0A556U032_BAGYA|nr:Epidermal differentiation-specific protein [Bagarius yarrelli]